jgi:D-alanyl-D-alanine carboxypeptidase
MLITKTLAMTAAAAVAFLAAPPAASAISPHAPGARTAKGLRAVVARLHDDGAPGALAVVRTPRGVVRAATGAEILEPRTPLRATDRFRVASITKPFVATIVLDLVAEGKLRLGDTVERWLPGLVPNGGAITLRELLQHRSGLFDYTADAGFPAAVIADPDRQWSPYELVAIATARPALFPPGAGWAYSNTNYVLLGLVIETVTGTPLEQQLRERIFAPLSLKATSFETGTDVAGRFVHGYVGKATLPDLAGKLLDVAPLLGASQSWAAGAIVSNGDDVTHFFAALLGGRLLRPDLLRAMKTDAPGASYGLGLMRTYTGCGVAFGHEGDFAGYRSVALSRGDGRRAAVVMVNIDLTRVSWGELEQAAAKAFCAK